MRPFRGAITQIMKIVGGLSGIIGLLAIFNWWPQVSVDPSAAADLVTNPLSSYFNVTNEQVYAIEDLSVEVSMRCAKIGRGDDTSPIDKCEPSMHSAPHRWTKHTLGPKEAYEITPGEVLFVTPGGLLYAQLDVLVEFKPWKIPVPFHRSFRFESRRLSDGDFQWVHIPSD